MYTRLKQRLSIPAWLHPSQLVYITVPFLGRYSPKLGVVLREFAPPLLGSLGCRMHYCRLSLHVKKLHSKEFDDPAS